MTPRPYLPNPEMVGRIIRSNLAELGVKTVLVEQGIHEHLKSVRKGDHDLCVLGWVGDNGDPDNFLYVLLDRDNTVEGMARNVAFFRDDEVHRLLIAAQQSASRKDREEIYMQAQERIAAQAPWVPLAHSRVSVAARDDIGGMVINPSTHVYFRGVSRKMSAKSSRSKRGLIRRLRLRHKLGMSLIIAALLPVLVASWVAVSVVLRGLNQGLLEETDRPASGGPQSLLAQR